MSVTAATRPSQFPGIAETPLPVLAVVEAGAGPACYEEEGNMLSTGESGPIALPVTVALTLTHKTVMQPSTQTQG